MKKNHIEIKTVIKCNEFPHLDIHKQTELYSFIIDEAINGCLTVPEHERIIIFKTFQLKNQSMIKVTYSSLMNKDLHSMENIFKELLQIDECQISIAEIQKNRIDMIIVFNQ